MQPRILVIGSKGHNRAQCVDWLQPFPNIEEYNFIIIDLQSLTQQVYDENIVKISQMREPIKTIFGSGREIFCIMNKLIYPSPPPIQPDSWVSVASIQGYVPKTNYDWFPFTIIIDDSKKGTSINISDHRFDKYFQCVDRWNLVISQSFETNMDLIASFLIEFVPIAENISKKMIGTTLRPGGFTKAKGSGKIHLLPPPTKCDNHQAIEIILDIICGKKEKFIPTWRNDVKIPEIEKLEHKIEKKLKGIKLIQQEISQLKNQLYEWDSYRDLLSTTGDDLENIVQKTLSDIGIKTTKAEKGFHVDLLSKSVAVEITGIKGTVGTGTRKVNQTGIFNANYKKDEKIVLIVNTQMDIQPNKRKEEADFSPEVVPYFEAMRVCCLTTKTLFLLWKDVKLGKINADDIKRRIMTKNGELRLDEFY